MIKDTIVFDCKNTINGEMWNFFVSENFMNNPFIGWHIESNFSLSIPTNQTWKNK